MACFRQLQKRSQFSEGWLSVGYNRYALFWLLCGKHEVALRRSDAVPMNFGELAFVALLFGVPLWLLLRAWRTYLAVRYGAVEDLFQMRMGLTLITLSTAMWFAVLVLMLLEDHSAEAKSLAIKVSPGILGLTNLLFCASGLVCSGRGLRFARQTGPLRRAIGLSSGCLMVIWLLFLANPH